MSPSSPAGLTPTSKTNTGRIHTPQGRPANPARNPLYTPLPLDLDVVTSQDGYFSSVGATDAKVLPHLTPKKTLLPERPNLFGVPLFGRLGSLKMLPWDGFALGEGVVVGATTPSHHHSEVFG